MPRIKAELPMTTEERKPMMSVDRRRTGQIGILYVKKSVYSSRCFEISLAWLEQYGKLQFVDCVPRTWYLIPFEISEAHAVVTL
jgi:hypothetical protein